MRFTQRYHFLRAAAPHFLSRLSTNVPRAWYRPSVGVPRDVGCRALVEYAANLFSAQFEAVLDPRAFPVFVVSCVATRVDGKLTTLKAE